MLYLLPLLHAFVFCVVCVYCPPPFLSSRCSGAVDHGRCGDVAKPPDHDLPCTATFTAKYFSIHILRLLLHAPMLCVFIAVNCFQGGSRSGRGQSADQGLDVGDLQFSRLNPVKPIHRDQPGNIWINIMSGLRRHRKMKRNLNGRETQGGV